MANTIFDTIDMTTEVYNANGAYNRTWMSYADLSKQRVTQSINDSYNKLIGQTFSTATQQISAINGSAMGSKYKQHLTNQINEAMLNAYDTYQAQKVNDIRENTAGYDQIQSTLSENAREEGLYQGEQIGSYNEQALTGYLTYLNQNGAFDMAKYQNYQQYQDAFNMSDDGTGTMLTEDQFLAQNKIAQAKYGKYLNVFNKDGTVNYDKMKEAIFSKRDENGEIIRGQYNFDEEGNLVLNDVGKDMLDQLHDMPSDEFESYSQWLSTHDKKLFLWSVQRSFLGNTLDTNARTAIKYMDVDGYYDFMERFGGLSKSQSDKIFGKLDLVLETASKDNYNDVNKRNVETINRSIDIMNEVFTTLHMTDMPQLQHLTYEKFKEIGVGGVIGFTAAGTFGSAAAGAAAGSVIPGVGTAVGALCGAIGGFIGGLASGLWAKDDTAKKGRDQANALKDQAMEDWKTFMVASASNAWELRNKSK